MGYCLRIVLERRLMICCAKLNNLSSNGKMTTMRFAVLSARTSVVATISCTRLTIDHSAQFGLKTRRHHCRLCGRVVCFLPPTAPYDTPPTRRERCSTFITYEYDEAKFTAGGEKNLSGTLVEIETVELDLSLGAVVNERGNVKLKDERTKVRVCRSCLDVVL